MQKRLFTFLLAIVLTFSFSNITYADNLKDKNKKLKNVKNNISDLKEKIKDVKTEKVQVTVQINKIESQITRVTSSISKLEGQIKLAKNTIDAKNKELNIAISDFNKYKSLYMKRLRAMYMNSSAGYLEILLSSENFADLISRTDLLKKVIAYDQKTLKDIKACTWAEEIEINSAGKNDAEIIICQ